MLRIFIYLLLSTCFTIVHAQTIEVTGRLIDNENQSALTGANVMLIGSKTYTAISEASGSFVLKGVLPGSYILQLSFVGYESFVSDKMSIIKSYDFGKIKLQTATTVLNEVVVAGKAPLALTKGDTVVYNADAYKTNPDANAEDLVKKIPGLVVADGKVQAQGEEVKKVYVDGKPFFDQDPAMALKNLPAEVIQKIEVFDEKSDQSQFTGFDDGDPTKIINIVTRSSTKNKQFGKFYLGGGLPDKYILGGNINLFNKDQRISIIGISNNINQQNFSNEDLLGVVGSNSRGGTTGGRQGGAGGGGTRSGGGSGNQDFLVGKQAGISKTTAFGINYSDSWGPKVEVSGSYFFNTSDNNKEQRLSQQYFTDSEFTSQSYAETKNSNSTNLNHRLQFKLEYDINDNNKLIVKPRISLQKNESENYTDGSSLLNDTLLNQNVSFSNSDMNAYNASNQLVYMHNFSKKGRTISFNLNTSWASRNSNRYQKSYQVDTAAGEDSDSLNLFSDFISNNNKIDGKLVFTEPIGQYSQIMLNAGKSVSFEESDRQAYDYDYINNEYNTLDTSLSNIYGSSYSTQQVGAGYKYRKDKASLTLGLDYEQAILKSEQLFPAESTLKNEFNSVLPMASFRYKFSKSKSMSVYYRSYSESPTITQLQNTVDYSNPLKLKTGNPALRPDFEQSLSLRYNATNTQKATLFFIMGSLRHSSGYIGNKTWFALSDTMINNTYLLQKGGQVSLPVNLDNYWNFRLYSTYGLPITKLKSNLNINLNYSYTNTPGITDDRLSFSENNIFGTGLILSSNISERIDFTISGNTNYNKAVSSLQDKMNNSYLYHKTEINLSLLLWSGITLRTAVSNQYYYYSEEDYDESFSLVNVEMGKKIFRNKRGELKLSVSDLFNQNNSITRTVSDIYVEDAITNDLQRFYLLSFHYQLRNIEN